MKSVLIILLTLSTLLLSDVRTRGEFTLGDSIRLADKQVVSFIYHRFDDNRYPSTSTSIKNFDAHIKYLKDNDFQIVTLSKAIKYLNSNEPYKKTAVLTIDDGYKSFLTNAFPILKKHGVLATLFINTNMVGFGDFINWKELKMLSDEGIEIGNHSETHQYFLNLPEASRYDAFRKEIVSSQQLIEEKLGIMSKVFAYPYGEYDNKMKAIVEESGFNAAVAQNSGVIHTTTDPYRMPRFPMTNTYASLSNFIEKTEMNSFVLLEETPLNAVVKRDENQPKLILKFNSSNLKTSQIQCFVQGGECEFNISKNDNAIVTLTAKSKAPLKTRRTLYTITVQDTNGKWHWFSHLWIKPELK